MSDCEYSYSDSDNIICDHKDYEERIEKLENLVNSLLERIDILERRKQPIGFCKWRKCTYKLDQYQEEEYCKEHLDDVLIQSLNENNYFKLDKNGKTALHVAIEKNNYNLCKKLLEKYPDLVTVVDKDDSLPLEYIIRHFHNDELFLYVLEMMNTKDLLKQKADYRGTVLHTSCNNYCYGLKQLIKKCPELVNLKDKYDQTPLFFAISGGLNYVEMLMDKMDPKFFLDKSIFGRTILHVAVQSRKNEIVQYLIKRVPKLVDITDIEDQTPLHWGVIRLDEDTLKLLIETMSIKSLLIKNHDGFTAMDFLKRYRENTNIDLLNVLLAKIAKK